MLAVETLAAGDIATAVDLPERQLDHFFSQAYSKHHKCFCVTSRVKKKAKMYVCMYVCRHSAIVIAMKKICYNVSQQ